VNLQEQLAEEIFGPIREATGKENIPIFCVGGFVRDLLLGRECKDVDFVCLGSGVDTAEAIARHLGKDIRVHVFRNFGTAQFRFADWDIEFVGARKESYDRNSRKPVVENGTLEDDQNRRDFTINALAISVHPDSFGELTDPFGGLEDLKNGLIRTPLDPDVTFSDDPLRMMRAIRFATQLGFTIEEKTYEALHRNRDRIRIISQERITDELQKIIQSKIPSIGFKLLENSGLLSIIFSELQVLKGVENYEGKGHKDNFYHTLQVLDNVAEMGGGLWLRWAALLHDIAKPVTKKFEPGQGWTFHGHEVLGSKWVPAIFRRFKLPMDDPMKFVKKLVFLHLRPIVLSRDEITDSAIRRLLFDAGDDIDALLMLCKADITTKNPRKMLQYLENLDIVRKRMEEVEAKDHLRNFQPPVDGSLIMQIFGLKPGREVGQIKEAIREEILEGRLPNAYEPAFEFMLARGKEMGLHRVDIV
jgi:poly(A) polymerase